MFFIISFEYIKLCLYLQVIHMYNGPKKCGLHQKGQIQVVLSLVSID